MLRELAADQLWIADMPAARIGFEHGARMTVVRLPEGGLFIHSPVELRPDLRQGLDALGPVRVVVSPSRMHYMHLADFFRAYPDARFYLPPTFNKKLEGVRIDGTLGDTPEAEWTEVLDQAVFRGSRLFDEVDFFHRPSRTLILTDLLFNIPTDRSWTTRLMARMLGILGRPAASREFGLMVRDRRQVQASLERILAWDFDRVILSHGDIVEREGKAAFRRAFARFLG